MNKYLCSWFK